MQRSQDAACLHHLGMGVSTNAGLTAGTRHRRQAPVPEAVRASVLCAAFSFRQGGWGWQGGVQPQFFLRPAAAF